MDALLDPAFVRELEALRRRLVSRAVSGATGDHLSKRRGGGAEFADHRAYAAGDDLRRIDWLAYARTGEPVIKINRAEEDVILRLVVDTSASLEGPKLLFAQRVAAAMGYMALASSERVQVLAATETPSAPSRPMRGRASLVDLLRSLSDLKAEGGTNLAAAIDTALAKGRPGVMVVVSDFLDPAGFDRPLRKASAAGNDLLLVQILSPEELEPSFDGDVLLEDAETGETLALTADATVLADYHARLTALTDALGSFARTHRAGFVRARSDGRLEDCVRRVVERRVDA